MNRKLYVYDIETLKCCFTYSAINIDTNEVYQFVIHKENNQLNELIEHLNTCKGQIGYNNLNFDYPIIHYILLKYKNWNKHNLSNELIILSIYTEAQRIISIQDSKENSFKIAIPNKYVVIPQMDLFKIWHYNNPAKHTSLKALSISLNFPNVMEMPIDHTTKNISLNEVKSILEYNLNDIMVTLKFYQETEKYGKIDLRKKIIKKYELPCLNWNNGKIGEQLILKLYCDKLGLDKYEIRKLRSYCKEIHLKDCIPNSIKFESNEFNKLLDFLKNKTIIETKNAFKYSLLYKEHKYDYGTGGLHGFYKSGVYISDDKYIIKSLDVASLYPNLPIVYNFYIRHLGIKFLEIYRDDIVNIRMLEKVKPKHEQDKAIIDGYKEACNIPYGKSNSNDSFLYDPIYTLKTTMSGQLAISMLCERLSSIPDSQMLMSNTDGCEIIIPREFEQMYYNICKQWELETKLTLEFADYAKIWMRDINNYGCITTSGKIKNKGCFEVDKVIGGEPAYYKDNSFRIIPLALQEYFVNNTPIEDTIKSHKNIYDFCGRQKFQKDSYGITHTIKYDENNNAFKAIEKQQKNVRYYISNNSSSFIKHYKKGNSEVIHVGYTITIFNKFEEMKNYNINYEFYIKECRKEINNIENKQLSLW